VTAKSSHAGYDFVSRFFDPFDSIFEDPVTGSSHTSLISFWASRLGKDKLVARQLSSRGGTLYCGLNGERVSIGGRARLYLEGEIVV
jgi:predicted PhzF superfamily epimerase YddE/YHI9